MCYCFRFRVVDSTRTGISVVSFVFVSFDYLFFPGNPKRHITALSSIRSTLPSGEPSYQNALELAAKTLRNIPSHASREIIAVCGSLTTCDPGNIQDTIRVGLILAENYCIECIGLALNFKHFFS